MVALISLVVGLVVLVLVFQWMQARKKLRRSTLDSQHIPELCPRPSPGEGGKCAMHGCDETHSFRHCRLFEEVKRKTSKHDYMSSIPRTCDIDGFCSAGVLFFYFDEQAGMKFLLQLEHRKQAEPKWWFFAGKREPQSQIIISGGSGLESPLQTARREFCEELNSSEASVDLKQLLLRELCRVGLVPGKQEDQNWIWLASAKMLLLCIDLTHAQNCLELYSEPPSPRFVALNDLQALDPFIRLSLTTANVLLSTLSNNKKTI